MRHIVGVFASKVVSTELQGVFLMKNCKKKKKKLERAGSSHWTFSRCVDYSDCEDARGPSSGTECTRKPRDSSSTRVAVIQSERGGNKS